MDKTKKNILRDVGIELRKIKYLQSAKVYGSWLYNESSVDMDIAVVVSSSCGVVSHDCYSALKRSREILSKKTEQDIDLVVHTEDEFVDLNSPLWYPRYNPSLTFGFNIKGDLNINSISTSTHWFSFSDLTAYVLHDNRTICRRQLIRSLSNEEGRIFVSKLLHGPGNALTYYACKHKSPYLVTPSNLKKCFNLFDEIYGVDSSSAMGFLISCKGSIDFERGVLLMNWYENLFNLVLHGVQFKNNYQTICRSLKSY